MAPFAWESKMLFFSALAKTVVSEILLGEFVISFILSCHSKNLKPRMDQCYSSMLQLSFIWQAKEWGWGDPRDAKRSKEKPSPSVQFWLLLLYVFSSPPDLHYVYWASQKGCLFYLRSSLWSSDLPLSYFRGLFPSLSLSHCHSGLLFPILTI